MEPGKRIPVSIPGQMTRDPLPKFIHLFHIPGILINRNSYYDRKHE